MLSALAVSYNGSYMLVHWWVSELFLNDTHCILNGAYAPPNKGRIGTNHFVLCKEVVLFSEVKPHSFLYFGYILCREVVPFSEGPLSEVPL